MNALRITLSARSVKAFIVLARRHAQGGRLIIKTANVSIDEAKAHLFEPFFTTKEQSRGTELGLAARSGRGRSLVCKVRDALDSK